MGLREQPDSKRCWGHLSIIFWSCGSILMATRPSPMFWRGPAMPCLMPLITVKCRFRDNG